MPSYILTVVLAVIGSLIVAGLIGWIKHPRLVVLVSRIFSYSQISEKGHLIELSVFNRGFKTEENIHITLNHLLSYEMVCANSQDISVNENKLEITRIGSSDEVTVLLLVENGVFKSDDIVKCLSKDTKGKVISKLENVPPTGNQRIGLVGSIIGLPLILYAGTIGMDKLLNNLDTIFAENKEVIKEEGKNFYNIQGWKVSSIYKNLSSDLFKSFSDKKILISIEDVTRKGDLVNIPIKVTNLGDKAFKVNIRMLTAASAKRQKSYELSTDTILLVPGASDKPAVKVVVPSNVNNVMERIVYIEVFLEDTDGNSLKLNTDYKVMM